MSDHLSTVRIEPVDGLPVIRMTRDFRATPAQLIRAHTDPELFARWVGPADISTTIDRWDARTGGEYRYSNHRTGAAGAEEYWFHGSFHHIGPDRLVQTFTWEAMPEAVSLDTLTFEDLGEGWTRLHGQSVVDSLEARDAMLASGMEVGINDGYAVIDGLLDSGEL